MYILMGETDKRKAEPHPDKLSQQLLDRIILARLSLDPNESHNELPKDISNELHTLHFDYLLNCWKQAYDIRKNTLLKSKVHHQMLGIWR